MDRTTLMTMKEEPDWKPDVFKLETELILSDDDEHYTGPSYEATCQAPNAASFNHDPSVLETTDLADSVTTATRSTLSEGHDAQGLLMQIKEESTEDKDPLAGPVLHNGGQLSLELDGAKIQMEDRSARPNSTEVEDTTDIEPNMMDCLDFPDDDSPSHSGAISSSCEQSSVQFLASAPIKPTVPHSPKKPLTGKQHFKRKRSLQGRSITQINARPVPCKHCSKTFTSWSTFKRHLRVHIEERPFSCKQCSLAFKSKPELTRHLRSHTDERPFSCEQCSRAFKSKSHLTSHLRAHTDERPFSCEQCSRAFKSKPHLTSHLRAHTDERPFSCKQCSWAFKSKPELNRHLRSHTDKRPFSCEQCSRAFKSKAHLTCHLRAHTDERPFSCKQCSLAFKSKPELIRHLRSHTDERPFSCEQCSRAFKSKAHLTSHLRAHTDERPFSCEQCSRAFKSKSDLTAHSRAHTDERPFSCEQCSRTFKSKPKLTAHLKSHTNERPFFCRQCSGIFISKQCLSAHLRTHTDKSFSSTECGSKALKSEENLTNRTSTQLAEKPFSCDRFPVEFKNKQGLFHHSLSHFNIRVRSFDLPTFS